MSIFNLVIYWKLNLSGLINIQINSFVKNIYIIQGVKKDVIFDVNSSIKYTESFVVFSSVVETNYFIATRVVFK